jgi:hypothetical protein
MSLEGPPFFLHEQACFISKKPTGFIGLYAPMVCCIMADPMPYSDFTRPKTALGVYAFVLLLLNALSRPRAENEKLLEILYSDGIVVFLVRSTR